MRRSVPDADRRVDWHTRRYLPLLPHMEHIDPRPDAAADVPRVLHLQLAAVSAASVAHRVDLAHPADRLQGYQGWTDGW